MADDDGLLTVELTTRHALVLSFAVGVLVGGFFMSTVNAVGGPTGALVGGNQSDSADTSRIQLPASVLEDEPALGSADAPLTIIEISDYACPWCAEWAGVDAIPQRDIDAENTFSRVREDYVESGEARFVYMDLPAHPNSLQAHVAANCVREQSEDRYWAFHEALFEQRDDWMSTRAGGNGQPDATFASIASNIGANATAMDSCISASDGSEPQQDARQLQQELGRIGTPTFLIGTQEDGFVKVEGAQPYSSLKPIIDAELSG